MPASRRLAAGAAMCDIAPSTSQHLYGFPNVPRMSRGVHDPLQATALAMHDGETGMMFIGVDAVIVGRALSQRCRQRIAAEARIPVERILISASHTHSAPLTEKMVASINDAAVPEPDPAYQQQLESGIVAAGIESHRGLRPAVVGLAVVDGDCLGGNRHDPHGPALPHVPTLSVRCAYTDEMIALMLICNMHPTVLHEDSLQVSADFPGQLRQYLHGGPVRKTCPIVYHMGVAGNQSPRHVISANTFDESRRIGHALGRRVAKALPRIEYRDDIRLAVGSRMINLPIRTFPSPEAAWSKATAAAERLNALCQSNATRGEERTAECDAFGANVTMHLTRLMREGVLQRIINQCVPAEIQSMSIGPWTFIGWPGEVFVEFAQPIMETHPGAFIITLANQALHGYIVTQEAVDRRFYEAGNTLWDCPAAGDELVRQTVQLISEIPPWSDTT